MRDLLRDEGAMALFKGLVPKVCRSYCAVCFGADTVIEILIVGPKLVFIYTISQTLIPWFARYVSISALTLPNASERWRARQNAAILSTWARTKSCIQNVGELVGNKWVFRIKQGPHGARYKARVVAGLRTN